MIPETEVLDKLFLELSQFTKATTTRELQLTQQLADEREKFAAESDEMLDKVQLSKYRIEELEEQLAKALAACKTKDELIEKFRRAIGDHYAPDDCYATGPLTGNDFLDLVQCPACSALAAYEEALPLTEPECWYDKHGMITHDPLEGVSPLYRAKE